MNTLSPWWFLAGGIILLAVMYEYTPRYAGWLLFILVLGYLLTSGRKGILS